MSKVDEELSRRFHRAERPVGSEDLFEGVARRRRRRRTLQRLQAGALAVAVLGATTGGFLALQDAFEDGGPDRIGTTLPGQGEIVFARMSADGHFHLFVARWDGTDVQQLTHGAVDYTDFAISPDGRWLTLVRVESDGSEQVGTVPFDQPDAPPMEPQFSSVSPQPAWSNDSSMLAVREGGSGGRSGAALLIVPVTGESYAAHLSGPGGDVASPSWSPGGRLVFGVLVDPPEAGWDLAIVSSDGTGFQWLLQAVGDQTAPTWSPDGSRIAFLRPGNEGDEIWTIAPDGTGETLIAIAEEASFEPDLAWAPDGSSLLVSDGAWIYRVDASPEGDVRDNFVQLVRGFAPSPIPAGSEPSVTTGPGPSASPTPDQEGRDIGLGFNLCGLERLDGIDWFGDGTEGTAWTGTRVGDDGRCGQPPDGSVLTADLDGDDDADVYTTVEGCLSCEPWAATDLDGNGTEELVVLLTADIQPTYVFYFAVPDGKPRASGIFPIFLGDGGVIEVGLAPEQTVRVQAGAGEEGSSANAIRCEGYPDDPVIVVARWRKDDRTGAVEYHGAKLRLVTSGDRLAAHFEVVETFTPTATSEDYGGDGKACGVDFNPWN